MFVQILSYADYVDAAQHQRMTVVRLGMRRVLHITSLRNWVSDIPAVLWGRRYREVEDDAQRVEAAAGQLVVYQVPVQSAVAILERADVDRPERRD